MNILDENMMVGSLVAKIPACASLFERVGIDYCCKGKRTLKELCVEKNLHLVDVLGELRKISMISPSMDWNKLSIKDLINHVIEKHHDYLRKELPRLSNLIYKVMTKHGLCYPELIELRGIFEELKKNLIEHLKKEELIVFPVIEDFLTDKPDFTKEKKENLRNHLSSLELEHTESGVALEKMNKLTNGYMPPVGACATHIVMLSSLAALEKDMREHVHKENHILFLHVLE
ncbi:MAG: DUF542 domain-containing protein [Candidatus Rhabdochlamydia sp.]